MFEFITVRELYEMIASGNVIETEGLEYVELDFCTISLIWYKSYT